MQTYILESPTGPDGLRRVERPMPEAGPGQLLVKVAACSLNYRDLMIAKTEGIAKPGIVPLSDGAGEVVAVGVGVEEFRVGDRVAGNFFQNWSDGPIRAEVFAQAMGGSMDGMLSEYVVLSAQNTVKIPDYYSFEEATTLPCAAVTVWNALFETTQLKPGETVLLLGTGGVSIWALQLAKAAGAHVIITSGSNEKLERAKSLGADATLNYRETPEWDKEVWKLTDKRGVDTVVEVGGAGTLEQSLRCARVGGTVALIGVLTGQNTINPMPVLYKVLNLNGVYVGSTRMFRDLNRALEQSQIRPVIDRVFAFDEVADAYRYQESGQHFGKIVIKVS